MSASHRALLLLSCWLASALAALLLAGEAEQRARQAQVALSESRQVELLAARLAAELNGPAVAWPPRDAARRAAEVLALMRAADDRHGVRWTALTLDSPLAGASGASSATAAERTTAAGLSVAPLPNAAGNTTRAVDILFMPLRQAPALTTARLSASGEYSSLAGLMALLQTLGEQGVSLTAITLDDNRVSLTAAVFNRRP